MIYNDPKIFILIKAISIFESGEDALAKGDWDEDAQVYRAYGHLQIRQGVVDDVNETYNLTHQLHDMLDYEVSCSTFWLWSVRYCRAFSIHFGRQAKTEDVARMWNGGFDGLIKDKGKTDYYWRNVCIIYEGLLSKAIEKLEESQINQKRLANN